MLSNPNGSLSLRDALEDEIFQIADFGLRVADCGLRVKGWRLWISELVLGIEDKATGRLGDGEICLSADE